MFGFGRKQSKEQEEAPLDPSTLVARQPIFDADFEVAGFELLFRGGPFDRTDNREADRATAQVLVQNILAPDMELLTNGLPAYVNFPQGVLLGDYAAMCDPERLVIEVLEDIEPDEAILAACRQLRVAGYRIALDDVIDVDRVRPFARCVDIVKVDLAEVAIADLGVMATELRMMVPGVTLLAEKVETWEQHRAARAAGFHLFQGYVLSRPQTMQRTTLKGFGPHYFQLLDATASQEPNFQVIENLVKGDLALTDQVLRLANSALYRRMFPPRSLNEALLRLGAGELRRVVALMVLAGMAEQQPQQLVVESVARARFCESLADPHGEHGSFDYFLAGMFSMIDAVLGMSMEDAVALLPLPEPVNAALVERRGRIGDVLDLVELYEHAEWAQCETLAAALNADQSSLAAHYREAVRWSWETTELAA